MIQRDKGSRTYERELFYAAADQQDFKCASMAGQRLSLQIKLHTIEPRSALCVLAPAISKDNSITKKIVAANKKVARDVLSPCRALFS
jgi:hypothetical protein